MKLKLLINHVPTRIYIPISQYTAKNDNLFLMSVFVANYGNNITLHFHFCDDLESRFDLHDVNKNTSTLLQIFD